tara:strand:- start:7299 stop:8567 length:1269 start_codon:yes stop_codon:yes gene_type:complete
MSYIFSSESVSEGHPDKIADQISDAILDAFLAFDKNSKVACEVMVTTGQVIISGEVNSKAYVDIQKVVREQIKKIGYDNSDLKFDYKSCGILTYINEQSPDIAMGVESKNPKLQGAGDQGIMFGYANNETDEYIPMTLDLSHKILIELAAIRKSRNEMKYLRPDSKCQVTIQYDNKNRPEKIISIVLSTQHDEFDSDKIMHEKIEDDIKSILIPKIKKINSSYRRLLSDVNIKYFINPTGKFVIGGPYGDTGLTGRKIIVDTYGGRGSHGGGAFSGKDSSKVDRSAAYAARHLAKNIVASEIADECLIQLSYAIGKPDPLALYVNTYGTSKLSISDSKISSILLSEIDLTPFGIIRRLKLTHPIYSETASYGHFGRTSKQTFKDFSFIDKKMNKINVELFTWEKLDYVDLLSKIFKDFYNEK